MHTSSIVLQDVTFIVRPAGRAKVLQERRKNVHAFVRGHICDLEPLREAQHKLTLASNNRHLPYCCVTYNPYKYKSFVDADTKRPILHADFCDMDVHDQNPLLAIMKA